MKQYLGLGVGLLAGSLIGAAAVTGLHAQAKPPIYYVSEIDVTNPDAYPKDYGTKMQALVKSHGGRQLAIGGIGGANAKALTVLDGTPPKRAVVQVWDSMEKLQAWRNDPQFKELRKTGEKFATWRSYAVEGQQ